MKSKAELAGLAFDPDYVNDHIHPNPVQGVLYDSRVGLYQFLPGRDRTIAQTEAARESVHSSAEDRHANARNPEYAPNPLTRYLARIGDRIQAH
jgi:hypothetical protein